MPILLLLLLMSMFASAETLVSGLIDKNERWTIDKSPYVVVNDLVIAAHAELLIDPGVEVLIEKPRHLADSITQLDQLDSFTVSIRVHGSFRVAGQAQNPVVFRGCTVEDPYTHWYGIVCDSRSDKSISIKYAVFSGAVTAISVRQGSPLIRNSLFKKNTVGVHAEGRSQPRIAQSLFTKNYLAAIRVQDANPRIYNSIITGNRTMGVWGDNTSEVDFRYNLCYGNEDRDYVDVDPLLGVLSRVNSEGDSVDYRYNLRTSPIFVGSPEEKRMKEALAKEDAVLQEKGTVLEETNKRHFVLSPYSPAIDAGHEGARFRELDGSPSDLGLWGGAEFLNF